MVSKTKKYHTFLTLEHRKIIEEGLRAGHSIFRIAKMILFSDKAIHREIARNSVDGVYTAIEAQKKCHERYQSHLAKARESIKKHNDIHDRVSALEALVKTLSKLIEELYDKINE